MSEARPSGVQLKRRAKLSTVFGLTTKHAVGRITYRLYPCLYPATKKVAGYYVIPSEPF